MKIVKQAKRAGIVIFTMALLSANHAFGQATGGDPNRVVVTVNGQEITAAELNFTANEVLPFLPNTPGDQRVVIITRTLIERHLLAQAAAKQGLKENKPFKDLLRFYETKALYDAFLVENVANKIDEEELRKRYEKDIAKAELPERIRARHILVGTQPEAQEIVNQLQAGEDFDALAKQYSLDGSKEFGGDLGYFTAQEMVPEFSKAAYDLQIGQVSKPVKTEFGWHVIKLEDRKDGTPPPFEQVRQRYLQRARGALTQREINRFAKEAKIEIIDPELKRLDEEAAKNAEIKRQRRLQQQQAPAGEAPATSGKGDRQ